MTQSLDHKRAWKLAKEAGLTADERHELTHLLVGYEGSWAGLTDQRARRVADALDGYVLVKQLIDMRPPTRQVCPLEDCEGYKDSGAFGVTMIGCSNLFGTDGVDCPLMTDG